MERNIKGHCALDGRTPLDLLPSFLPVFLGNLPWFLPFSLASSAMGLSSFLLHDKVTPHLSLSRLRCLDCLNYPLFPSLRAFRGEDFFKIAPVDFAVPLQILAPPPLCWTFCFFEFPSYLFRLPSGSLFLILASGCILSFHLPFSSAVFKQDKPLLPPKRNWRCFQCVWRYCDLFIDISLPEETILSLREHLRFLPLGCSSLWVSPRIILFPELSGFFGLLSRCPTLSVYPPPPSARTVVAAHSFSLHHVNFCDFLFRKCLSDRFAVFRTLMCDGDPFQP